MNMKRFNAFNRAFVLFNQLSEEFLKFHRINELGLLEVEPRPHQYDQEVVSNIKKLPLSEVRLFDEFSKKIRMDSKLKTEFLYLIEAVHLGRYDEYAKELEERKKGAEEIRKKYPWLTK